MNLDNIKYPYMLVKFKKTGTEIQWGNALKVTNQTLQRVWPLAARSLHIARIHATKE